MKRSMQPSLVLKPGREKSLLQRHPWVFSGAIASTHGEIGPGTTVEVLAADGRWLARAAVSPASQIRARVWTFDPAEAVDAAFFDRRIRAAVAARGALLGPGLDSVRLVHAESDGLPGLIVDGFADVLVVQVLAAGAEAWREAIVGALVAATGCATVFERSDAEVRTLEGLAPRCGPLRGETPAACTILENGQRFGVDVGGGQKTGYYLDQRDNRRHVAAHARDRQVLDAFCYTGGFGVAALGAGARSLLALDSSADALAAARTNAARNGVDDGRATWVEADVFKHLRLLRDQGRRFDLIVLDPPKLAPTAQHVERAARAYKDINLLGFKLLRPGGLLATFSCSGGVGADLFRKIVFGAAVDARVDGQVIERYGAGADHPVLLSFPEGEYLKGLLIRLAG